MRKQGQKSLIIWRCWDDSITREFMGACFPPAIKRLSFSPTMNLYKSQQIPLHAHSSQRTCTRLYVNTSGQIILPIHFLWRKSILCTSYNSWFLVLKEHPICIPHWVFHPLCTAANLCPTCLEVIQLTKTLQSGRVFLGVVLLTCG